MRIGELARRAGTTLKAVRYYEALGLVTPDRLANGYRDYGEHDVRVVREIRALSGLGIPVERTRPFLDCLAAGGAHADDCPASLAGYREAIDDLSARIEALTERRAVLAAHLRRAAYRNSVARASDVPGREGEHPVSTTTTIADRGRSAPQDRTAPPHDHAVLPAGLPVPEDDGGADHLPGLPLPGLGLTATTGAPVRLDALGPGRTVLYVYPLTGRPDTDLPEGWDGIPGARGCTAEACDFRDHHAELRDAGAARVFGLSSQDTAYQREVVERLRLPFAMLSDPDRALGAALRLPEFDAAGTTLYKRLTMIVRDGLVEHVFYPVFPPNEHGRQVLTWLRENPA
ncbi:MerR family transcriptional regulator [Streptomyces sp. NPDC093225]|uniref:MerR family transcriptional regulator n=1 Tax=Streptomyces sp. NPDC093225 TaxID=3366034 RepID=UPI00381437A7